MTEAVVLTFHGLISDAPRAAADDASKLYAVESGVFRQAMRLIAPDSSCTVSGLASAAQGRRVVLTFDDGLLSDFEVAYPILQEHGLKATFYVTAGNIGQKGYCGIRQLAAMAEGGMEIGSHGLTHRYLTTMPESEALREIRDSKAVLEDRLGVSVSSYAAVGGHYGNWMCEAALEAGYTSFASMIPGKTSAGNGFCILRRNHIQNRHGAGYIAQLIRGRRLTLSVNLFRYYCLYASRRILGMESYDRLKSVVLRSGS